MTTITPTQTSEAVVPRVPWGLASVLGVLGALGVIAGAIESNDALTVVSGIGALAIALGRQAQAIVGTLRGVARAAKPYVDALAADEYDTLPNVARDGAPGDLSDETSA